MSDTSNPTSTTTTTNATSTPNQPPISWELIGQLTNDEYMARRAEIQRFINNPKNKKGR